MKEGWWWVHSHTIEPLWCGYSPFLSVSELFLRQAETGSVCVWVSIPALPITGLGVSDFLIPSSSSSEKIRERERQEEKVVVNVYSPIVPSFRRTSFFCPVACVSDIPHLLVLCVCVCVQQRKGENNKQTNNELTGDKRFKHHNNGKVSQQLKKKGVKRNDRSSESRRIKRRRGRSGRTGTSRKKSNETERIGVSTHRGFDCEGTDAAIRPTICCHPFIHGMFLLSASSLSPLSETRDRDIEH